MSDLCKIPKTKQPNNQRSKQTKIEFQGPSNFDFISVNKHPSGVSS